jgi:hypothetical protein
MSGEDPKAYLDLEQAFARHARRVLAEDRLRVETVVGWRSVSGMLKRVEEGDDLVSLRRALVEAGQGDRETEKAFPRNFHVEVELLRRRWFVFTEKAGRVRVKVVSPIAGLARGEGVVPLGVEAVKKELAGASGYPETVVLVSTSGFDAEAKALAGKRGGVTVVLFEPGEAGGWVGAGPAEAVKIWDPEAEAEKRSRVREVVEGRSVDLGESGVSAERIARETRLPLELVESELKSLARETPGLAARKLDGRLVLFRQGAGVQPVSGQEPAMIEKIKALFGKGGESEKKIAFLSERRAALGQQRDRLYEELGALETKEVELKEEFKVATGTLGKRRITSQLLQLRKDAERRQQLLTVLNQQVSVVGVHLHNLELARTGTSQGLPNSDEIAEDAAKAEQVLAELQASSELAEGVGGGLGGISDEESALMAELEAELHGPAATPPASGTARPAAVAPTRSAPQRAPASPGAPMRNEPEAG